MVKIKDWLKKYKVITIVICVIIALLPIVLYVLKFKDCSISDDPADWGSFGDYIGGIYGGFFSCLFAVLAIYLTRALEHKDKKKEKTSETAEKIIKLIADVENYNNKRTKLSKINKLRCFIHENWLYVSDIKDDVIQLCDDFQSEVDGNGYVEEEMKKSILKQLEKMYE